MNSNRVLLTVLSFIISLYASAKEITDTLYSVKNDRIIVSYNITRKDNTVELQFRSARKLLGDYHQGKYKREVDKVHTLFFDWNGVRKDMKFTGETPSVVCLPAKAAYQKSSDGYFIIEQRPTFVFDMESSEAGSFTIPLYLAHYEGKQHYKILCSCGNLEIRIPDPSTQSPSVKHESKQQLLQNTVEVLEIEEELSEFDDEALMLIKLINKDLPNQDTLPMESTLERKIENLGDLQAKIKNEDIVRMIDETLETYNTKKKELERTIQEKTKQKADNDAFTICSTKEEYELYLKQHPNGSHVEEAKAKVGELEAKAKEEEDSKKRRNIWMIIGGVLLAILLFIGNQALQSLRNIRTQRSMMQMQQDATKRAQSMARSKAQSEIRKQTNKVAGQAKNKGQTMMRDAANKVKNNNGNNRMSI
jgi:hypothetical protein